MLAGHNIDLVVLAGFLSVLGPSVIAAYPNRILNVHPSLIPSFCGPGFYGLRVHEAALARGEGTEKEQALWQFVVSAYGGNEFSTKQLERDFGNAAYATIRSFVLKFEKLGLLRSIKYGNRVKYSINKYAQ